MIPIAPKDRFERSDRRVRRSFDALTGGLFLLLITIPGVGSFLHDPTSSIADEYRRPNAPPAAPLDVDSVKRFPESFRSWAGDHVLGRASGIRFRSIVFLEYLGVSPVDTIVVGKGGWLFFAGDDSFRSFRGEIVLSREERAGIRRMLERRQDFCAARGIACLFVVVPDKQTIYPERLPTYLVRSRGESVYEQIRDELRSFSDVRMLDLSPVLTAAKEKNDVYYPHGSHWTVYGSLATYRAVMRAVGELVPTGAPYGDDDFNIVKVKGYGDSFDEILHVIGRLHQDHAIAHSRPKRKWRKLPSATHRPSDRTTENSDGNLPKVVFFHNSFMNAWGDLFAPHFSRLVGMHQRSFDWEFVRRENPDIVVFEIVERLLNAPEEDPIPPDSPYEPWLGVYQNDDNRLEIRAVEDDDGAIAMIDAHGERRLARIGTGIFGAADKNGLPIEVRFLNEKRSVIGLSLRRGSGANPTTYRRISKAAVIGMPWRIFDGRYESNGVFIDLTPREDGIIVLDATGRTRRKIIARPGGGHMIEGAPAMRVILDADRADGPTIEFGEASKPTIFKKIR